MRAEVLVGTVVVTPRVRSGPTLPCSEGKRSRWGPYDRRGTPSLLLDVLAGSPSSPRSSGVVPRGSKGCPGEDIWSAGRGVTAEFQSKLLERPL